METPEGAQRVGNLTPEYIMKAQKVTYETTGKHKKYILC
jgi:6-phosphogluconolactonase/glucosamine-6-phosphate isomerase/deaminase